jgi:hypothetical protein
MKTIKPKTIPTITPEPAVKPKQSKPVKKTGLSKKDPNYYAKIGAISAAKRKLSKSFFSEMARKSHNPESRPEGYRGGRKKKAVEGTNGATLAK